MKSNLCQNGQTLHTQCRDSQGKFLITPAQNGKCWALVYFLDLKLNPLNLEIHVGQLSEKSRRAY